MSMSDGCRGCPVFDGLGCGHPDMPCIAQGSRAGDTAMIAPALPRAPRVDEDPQRAAVVMSTDEFFAVARETQRKDRPWLKRDAL